MFSENSQFTGFSSVDFPEALVSVSAFEESFAPYSAKKDTNTHTMPSVRRFEMFLLTFNYPSKSIYLLLNLTPNTSRF